MLLLEHVNRPHDDDDDEDWQVGWRYTGPSFSDSDS